MRSLGHVFQQHSAAFLLNRPPCRPAIWHIMPLLPQHPCPSMNNTSFRGVLFDTALPDFGAGKPISTACFSTSVMGMAPTGISQIRRLPRSGEHQPSQLTAPCATLLPATRTESDTAGLSRQILPSTFQSSSVFAVYTWIMRHPSRDVHNPHPVITYSRTLPIERSRWRSTPDLTRREMPSILRGIV